MSKSLNSGLTDLRPLFLQPRNPIHRQYEALRAFFVEGLCSAQVAERFGYTPRKLPGPVPRTAPESRPRVLSLLPAGAPGSAARSRAGGDCRPAQAEPLHL